MIQKETPRPVTRDDLSLSSKRRKAFVENFEICTNRFILFKYEREKLCQTSSRLLIDLRQTKLDEFSKYEMKRKSISTSLFRSLTTQQSIELIALMSFKLLHKSKTHLR